MSADSMMMTAFVSHSLVAAAREDETDRIALEAEMGAQVVAQGLMALELEDERRRALAESSRVVKRSDLERWARELSLIADRVEFDYPSSAGLLQELRSELPNAGEPFKEVPYA